MFNTIFDTGCGDGFVAGGIEQPLQGGLAGRQCFARLAHPPIDGRGRFGVAVFPEPSGTAQIGNSNGLRDGRACFCRFFRQNFDGLWAADPAQSPQGSVGDLCIIAVG